MAIENHFKMLNKRYYILLGVFAGFSSLLDAQTDKKVDQSVQVVREYSPTVLDASKMHKMPVLDDTSSYRPVFRYGILDRVSSVSTQPETISAARMSYKGNELLYRSFLRGGVGNYGTVMGDYAYNILNNKDYLFGFYLGHHTSLGRLKLENDYKVDAPFHDTEAGLNFKYFVDRYTFSSNLKFDHHMYQFYGLQTLNPDATYLIGDKPVVEVPGDQLFGDKNERWSGFDANFGFANNLDEDAAVDFQSNLGLHLFSTKTGVKQNGFALSGSANFPVAEYQGGIEASLDYFKVGVPDTIGPMYYFNERSNTLVRIKPHVDFVFNRFKLRAGIAIVAQIEENQDDFYLMPDVKGVWDVADGAVRLYGVLRGDLRTNSYREVIADNPFVSADVNVASSATPIAIEGGIDARFSQVVNFNAQVGYSVFTDEHFFVNKPYSYMIDENNSALSYSNRFTTVYDDGNLFKASAELTISPGKKSQILAKVAYYGWQTDVQEKAWHKPETELGVSWRFYPTEKLMIDGGLTLLGRRYALDVETLSAKKLDAVVDFSLGGEYYVSQQFSLFMRLNNLAASKYYRWNGYPSHGINLLAGLTFSF